MRKWSFAFVAVILLFLMLFSTGSAAAVEPEIVNLAHFKPISASSDWLRYPISNAVDGDVETYWESVGYPANLVIDLQVDTSVSSVQIQLNPDPIWEARTQDIEVLLSPDDKEYTCAAKNKKYFFDPETGNKIDIVLNTLEGRYLKLVFSDGSWKNGAQIAELIVNGYIDVSEGKTFATSIPYEAAIFEGHAYMVYTHRVPWEEARKICEARGGHLVTITSREEQTFLENLIAKKGELWIGLKRQDNNSFAWITGEEFSFSDWGSGEPNNFVTQDFPGENVAAMRPSWNDYHEKNLQHISGYICEWDSPSMNTVKETNMTKTDLNETSESIDDSKGSEGGKWGSIELNDAEISVYSLQMFLGKPSIIYVKSEEPYDAVNSRYIYIGNEALGCDLGVAVRASDNQMYFWSMDLSPDNLRRAQLVLDEKAPFCSVIYYEGSDIIDSAVYSRDFSSVVPFDVFEKNVARIVSALSEGDLVENSSIEDPIISCFPGLAWGLSIDDVLRTFDNAAFEEVNSDGGQALLSEPDIYGKKVKILLIFNEEAKLNMLTAVTSEEDKELYLNALTQVYGIPLKTSLLGAMMGRITEIEEDMDGDCYAWKSNKSLVIWNGTLIEYLPLY